MDEDEWKRRVMEGKNQMIFISTLFMLIILLHFIDMSDVKCPLHLGLCVMKVLLFRSFFLALNFQGRDVSSWKFDLFYSAGPQGGYLGGS